MLNIKQKKNESQMIGDRIYRVQINQISTPYEWSLHNQILKLRDEGKECIDLIRHLNSISKVQTVETHNLLPTAGRTAMAQHLTQASPSPTSLKVNYIALGTGSASPANSDTTLGTEVYRNLVASSNNSNNLAYITGFFSATEVSGSFTEVGLFMGATATVDSGTLFSRALLSVSKTSIQTLTVDYIITIN